MTHKVFNLRFVLAFIIGLVVIPAPQSARAAGSWYVTPTGDDNNDCMSTVSTCATINGAIGKAAAGDTVLVAIGTYTSTGSNEVVLLDRDVTLSGGWDDTFTTQGGMSTIDGGGARRGIFVNSSVVVAIEYFVIQNGFFDGAFNGGGGIRNDGNLTLNNSMISNNSAINCGEGGNIYNTGTLAVNNSTIQNGSTVCGGGALENSGDATLTNSSVKNNSGVVGLDNNGGNMTLIDTTVSGTTGSGHGINNFNNGAVNVNDSSISDNVGAGILIQNGTLTVNNSSVHHNSGGGISNSGTVTLNNSTVSSNGKATSSSSGIYNDGTVTLNSTTITNNVASSGTGGITNFGTATLQNTILSGNTGSVSPDCSGTIDSAGYNLVGNTTSCTFSPGTGDLTNVDAKLGFLVGSPAYHPLASNSPGVDAGNPNGCTGSAGLLTTDQRGATRVGRCDIGAYEYTTPGPAASISAYAGTPQRTPPLSAFKTDLQVLVLDSIGSPISDVAVTFTAPASGPSGTFADSGTFTTSATTKETGIATASTLTANGQLGSYSVTATTISLPNSASFALTNAGWFVAPTGDDSNSCASADAPCLTINGAIGKAAAGDTVKVAVGTYTNTGSEVVLINKDINLSGGWDETFTTHSGMSTIDGQGVRRGISLKDRVTVFIERFVVQNGFADFGGGIENSFGDLTLNNSIISNNTASDSGGGIYHGFGILNLNSSIVSANTTTSGSGGGIYIYGDSNSGGKVTLNNSTVSTNTGYGILNFGSLILNNSTISSNTGGGILNYWHDATINNSTISNNTGNDDGGGLYNYIGNVVINNTTISSNSALYRGGGISVSSGTVSLNNSTLSGNTTTSGIYGGGGIFNSGATVTLQNTLLARNTTSGMGPDCNGFNSIDSSGHNLIGDTTNCNFTPNVGDLTNIDPKLGLLMGLSGAARYHPLLAGSPAIDAGNPAGCTDQDGNLLTTDQRGVARVGTCDIGAYEYTVPGPAANLSVVGGDNQIAGTSSAFSKPLQAAALDSQGSPVSGVTIDFAAPASGASGTFAYTGTNTTSVDTDAGGVATTSIFTANDQAGAYTISASASGLTSVNFNLEQILRPANDNFANAQAISPSISTTADITDATKEPNEPQNCYSMDRTVWYSFTPTESMVVRAHAQGGNINGNVNIYRAGSGISDLQFMSCTGPDGSPTFLAEANQTYYLQAGSAFGEVGSIQVNLEQVPPPANDNFANAIPIGSLPSTIDFDTSGATLENGEQTSCGYPFPPYRTIWFAFTASQDGSISASIPSSNFAPFLAAYSGTGFNNLTQLVCGQYSNKVTFHVVQGQTYYLQVGGYYGEGGPGQFLLENAPAPEANFYFYPGDPSKYDTIQFCSSSNDPGNVGIESFTWDFGDGATATEGCSTHRYTADGNYTVQHTVTTFDGRTAAATPQVVQVRTHDVAITKVTAPNSANSGQTKSITVTLRNKAYPETVQIDLYKSTPTGFELVATVTKSVPALSGNRTTAVNFSYKFTSDDARIGKVTFKAVATLIGARDAFPIDNEAISSPPTKVGR